MTLFRVVFDEKTGQWAAKITKKQHQNIIKMVILWWTQCKRTRSCKKHSVKCDQNSPKMAKIGPKRPKIVFFVTPFEIIEWVLLTKNESVSRHSEGNEHHEFCFWRFFHRFWPLLGHFLPTRRVVVQIFIKNRHFLCFYTKIIIFLMIFYKLL